jgi:DNA-binding transcriptional ArsR family regulator
MMVSSDVLARAVGHPMRVRIIAALDDGPCALDTLAARVGGDRKAVAGHARLLAQAGLVRSTRVGRTSTYELVSQPAFSDDEYEALSLAAREAAVAAALANAHTAAATALESGGFDRPEVHVSRTPLELTEAQWRSLSSAFAELLERVEAARADGAAEADEATIKASAVLMLFERGDGVAEHPAGDRPPEEFSQSEGLVRSWELCEELEGQLQAAQTDWASVISLADQLRVLARSALAAELRATPARPPVGTDAS